jgi:hypothetical protein
MTLSVAQLIREIVLLRNESEFVDAYLFRTTFVQGATGALLILSVDTDSDSGFTAKSEPSFKCFSLGSEMASHAATFTSWSEFLECRHKFGFKEDLDYFESTYMDSTSNEPGFYFGHALRDGRGECCGCVIYSSKTASSHERMDSLIGEVTPLCLARLLAPAQALWIEEFEKRFNVSNLRHSIFPIFGDSIRKLGHDINNNLATLSLQLQSCRHNADSASYISTAVARSLLAVQRIDQSVEVLGAFSSIVLNESNTSHLENYVMATFETLRKDYTKLFLSISIDENFEYDRAISLDGPCLLFLIHNFIRTTYISGPVNNEDPIAVMIHADACKQHSNCATLSVSAEIRPLIDPVLDVIASRPNDKIGGALPPPVMIVINAARKIGAEYVVIKSEETVTLELHLPLAPA